MPVLGDILISLSLFCICSLTMPPIPNSSEGSHELITGDHGLYMDINIDAVSVLRYCSKACLTLPERCLGARNLVLSGLPSLFLANTLDELSLRFIDLASRDRGVVCVSRHDLQYLFSGSGVLDGSRGLEERIDLFQRPAPARLSETNRHGSRCTYLVSGTKKNVQTAARAENAAKKMNAP